MAELRPYTPTWRDTVASWMMGQGQSSPERRAFVGGLLGSTGLGNTGVGVVDATPVGGLLSLQEASQAGDKTGMALASAGLIPGAGVAEKVAAKVAERSAPAAEKFITAYHGSPHSFDKFSLDKIGTGEGAQAYGHGLYFADNEGVAKAYRDQLSYQNKSIDGKKFYGSESHAHSLLSDAMDTGGGIEDAIRTANEQLTDFSRGPNKSFSRANIAREALTTLNDWKARNAANFDKGSMYQVRINADPEHFLDWDKPITQQPILSKLEAAGITSAFPDKEWSRLEALKQQVYDGTAGFTKPADGKFNDHFKEMNDLADAIKAKGFSLPYGQAGMPDRPILTPTGEDIYRGIRSGNVGADKLRAAGIPGIKYLDGGSRGAGEGSSNYVVFDDSLIDILKKYGLVGLLGGGAAMGAGQQQQQGVPSL